MQSLRNISKKKCAYIGYIGAIFLGARAPLQLVMVVIKKSKGKVSNSNNLLSPASTCTLIVYTQ